MRGPERVALFRRLGWNEWIEPFGMRVSIGPIFGDAGPFGPKSFGVRIGVLDDESLDPFWMHQHDAETNRAAIVMKEECAFVDFELRKKMIDRLRQMVESVSVDRGRWSIALAKARKIRRYQVAAGGEQRNERVELAGRGGKAVQENDRRRVLRTCFAIKHADSVDDGAVIGGCRGGRFESGGGRDLTGQ